MMMNKIINSLLGDLPEMNPFELEMFEKFMHSLGRSSVSGIEHKYVIGILLCIKDRRERIKEFYAQSKISKIVR